MEGSLSSNGKGNLIQNVAKLCRKPPTSKADGTKKCLPT